MINSRSNKKQYILDYFLSMSCLDNCTLYMASCYFSVGAAKDLIDSLIRKGVFLDRIFILVDKNAAFSIGLSGLLDLEEAYGAVLSVSVVFSESGTQFHTKAYAIFDNLRLNNFDQGVLVLGSANLTGRGLTNRNGNIESLIGTSNEEDLHEFLESINNLHKVPVRDFLNRQDLYLFDFKYALIREGVFMHRWSEDMKQYFAVRYFLAGDLNSKVDRKIFESIGFQMDAATISKKYFDFDFDFDLSNKNKYSGLVRKYGVETHLGYWIPKIFIDGMSDDKDFDVMKSQLFDLIGDQIGRVEKQIAKDLAYLKKNKIIDVEHKSPIDMLLQRITSLETNRFKLEKMFFNCEFFELPYDESNQEKIDKVFDEIKTISESRSSRNVTMKALIAATDHHSIKKFGRTLRER